MKVINVRLKQNPYKIYIEHNIFKNIGTYLKRLKLGNLGIVITSPKILSLYKETIKKAFKGSNYKIIKVPDGEEAKSKVSMLNLINNIVKSDGWNKRLFVVCLGGGTIGDLGGFVASIYKRGIPYIQIPTTLLSQIDSGIGGKTAIDLPAAKNILGSFYQPKAVFIDPLFLKTLPASEIKQGIAEVIKYGIIRDKNFFYYLKKNYKNILKLKPSNILKVIDVCARIKARIVEDDELEKKGIRTILNFGHTLAHALESAFKYKNISHGEAVSLGMVYAAKLSFRLKRCKGEQVDEILRIIELFSLPTETAFNHQILYKSLSYDKKFVSGKIRMVLLNKIGKVEVVENISPVDIRQTLKTFCA
jgi:3-dehydroquinate synthase